MRNDDVQDLFEQLNRLQVQQSALLVRLERATVNVNGLSGVFESETGEPKAFAVGDHVTIKNPNPFQTDKGMITKIGKKRITVTTASGQKIVRAPKNILAQE